MTGIDEYPSSTSEATRTCMLYDTSGNVKGVVAGCAATATPGDCSTCSQPLAQYQYDDFGNIVTATLPWTDNGSNQAGVTHFSYDAFGNVVNKQTPAMAPNGDYLTATYDALSRELALTHNWALPSAGNETLYSMAYDNSATLSGTCPSVANTKGRLLNRTDSFGQTWFQYDIWGRTTAEIRLRTGSTSCAVNTPNTNPHTFYTYSLNGNLTSVTYPYGRVVTYNYGTYPSTSITTDRVTGISVSSWNGSSWSTLTNVISNVLWEPYGGLKGYQINHPTTGTSSVEYLLDVHSALAPDAGSCPQIEQTGTDFDYTERLRQLWVSSITDGGTFTPGIGAGDIYARTYTWNADQVVQTDTCALGSTAPRTEQYRYDQMLRLVDAGSPTFSTQGGTFSTRAYGYDGRGNRTGQTNEDCAYKPTLAGTPHVDQLAKQASSCGGAILKHSYTYDRDGRAASKTWASDSTGDAGYSLTFSSGELGSGSHGADDTVFKAISVNGAVYNYYYDGSNRRRAKVYPAGAKDEFFYDTNSQMLVDQGNNSTITPTFYTDDDYVWLGGRPVMIIRGKLNASWARQADTSADCTRNGDLATCGFYFPITDVLNKPVAMLDASKHVAAVADYDPFGQLNRVTLDKETAHPYANSTSATLATFTQHVDPSAKVSMRVLFNLIDTESNAGVPSDFVRVLDGTTNAQFGTNIGGNHAGQVWSAWAQPTGGQLKVTFTSNSSNCCPNGSGGLNCTVGTCSQYPNYPYTGAVMEGYEYRRYQTTATNWFFTPLRFPGQYYDAESDLNQNWNRFYDPAIGKYLQGEPMLVRPEYARVVALTGHSSPAYSYSRSNPLSLADATGLCPGMWFYGANAAQQAAIDALLYIYPSTQLNGHEYGGWICANPDGSSFATQPAIGSTGDVPIHVSSCPSDSLKTGYYHTHPDQNDTRNLTFPFSLDDTKTCSTEELNACWLARPGSPDIWQWLPGLNWSSQIYPPPPPGPPWWQFWKW